MDNISLRLGAAIIGVFLTTAIVAGGAYAFGGWTKFGGNNDLKNAIEQNDYSVLGENPKITEEQFNKMTEAAKLMEEGKFDEARELREEAGIGRAGLGMGQGMMKRGMMGREMPGMRFDAEKKEAVMAALEAGDYDAWLAAVGEDCPLKEKITRDNFSRYVEAYNHLEEAHAIMEELGIKQGMGMGWTK